MARTAPVPLERVQAHIEGEISGQVAVGDRNVQIGSIHGGVVTVSVQDRPQVRPRARPVSVLPRPFSGLLGRQQELEAIGAALQIVEPVDVCGPEGVGKTSLLRHLAHHAPDVPYPDGIVHLSGHQPLEDLQESLHDAFFATDVPYKESEAEIRHALQGIKALVVLDDVDLSRDEVGALLDSAPHCGFVLAASERHLWGQGCTVPLKGLPIDAALALVERELGRPLNEQERADAEALCTALDGSPLNILQAVAEAQESGRSLAEAASQLLAGAAPTEGGAAPNGTGVSGAVAALTDQILASLPEQEQQVVTALAALRGAPVSVDHLSALTQLADPMPVLEALQKRGLVQAHSPRYSLTGDLAQAVAERWDLETVREQALDHLTEWAEGQWQQPERLLEDAEALIEMLRWAVEGSRWVETLRLGRAFEGALALGRRWGAWLQVLQWMLQAARAVGDSAATAYALHQLGIRTLCLGDLTAARAPLEEALQIRRALGDPAGADVTRYHLDWFLTVPSAGALDAPTGAVAVAETVATPAVPLVVKVLAVVLLIVLLAAGGVVIYLRFGPTPTSTTAPTATLKGALPATDTPLPTSTPSITPTHTPTALPTSTATPTLTPSVTPTLTPSVTPTPTASVTPSHTATSTSTPTLTPTPTVPTPTPTVPTPTPTVPTPTPTVPTPPPPPPSKPRRTSTPTFTPTPTPTPTFTPTPDTVGPSIGAVSIVSESDPEDCPIWLTAQCTVVDTSDVQQVILRFWFTPVWNGSEGEKTVAMTPADNLYTAAFRLNDGGTLRYRVEARDTAGNASASPIEIRTVVGCPGEG